MPDMIFCGWRWACPAADFAFCEVFVIRYLKILLCMALVAFVLSPALTVYADDETTQTETSGTSESSEANSVLHVRTCRHWAGVLVDDGIIDASSYYYICYDTRNGGYNAFISSAPFYVENYQMQIMRWYESGGCYRMFPSRDEIANTIQICDTDWVYNGPFGGGGTLHCSSDVVRYHSDDGVSYSEVGNVRNSLVYNYVDGRLDEFPDRLTFLEFGLTVPENMQEGFYPIDFGDVYANFVPYMHIEDTEVALDFAGFTVTAFDDVPSGNGGGNGDSSETSEESSFFQVSRIPQTVEVILWKALPAAIIILGAMLLLRILRHFGIIH